MDTHTLVWWIKSSPMVSDTARAAIASEESVVFVSVISAWEIAIKVGRGKWPDAEKLLEEFEPAIAEERFQLLTVSVSHARKAGLLASDHRDPFDRLLAAQASIEGLTLVSADARMAQLGAAVLW